VLLLVVIISGCASGSTTPATITPELSLQPVSDYSSLINSLRREGVSAEPVGSINPSFFSVEGRMVKVNGEEVQAFEYADEAKARGQAKLISPDGSTIGMSSIFWVAPPHFYKAGKIIVLYVGKNDQIVILLEKVLGVQFTGRQLA
jgi:hypothetical protein